MLSIGGDEILRILNSTSTWMSALDIASRRSHFDARNPPTTLRARIAVIATAGDTSSMMHELVEEGLVHVRTKTLKGAELHLYQISDAGRRRTRAALSNALAPYSEVPSLSHAFPNVAPV